VHLGPVPEPELALVADQLAHLVEESRPFAGGQVDDPAPGRDEGDEALAVGDRDCPTFCV
jgi:hypothetical protein